MPRAEEAHSSSPPLLREPRTIPLNDIVLDELASSQESVSRPSYIFRGTWSQKQVAVKKMAQEWCQEQLARHSVTWRQLKHPNILDVHGVSESTEDPPFVVLPYQENGNIQQYVSKTGTFDRSSLVLDVALGMQYLHARGIVHGGLKPSNILVNVDGHACVSDYDMMHIQPSRNLDAHRYYSPEAWKGTTSKPSDVFAFAMCTLEIFTSTLPWGVLSEKRIYRLVVHEDARPDRPDDPIIIRNGLTDKIWSIIEESWDKESRLRPSFNIIVNMWRDPALDEASYSIEGGQRTTPDPSSFDNRDHRSTSPASSRTRRMPVTSIASYATGPPAYDQSEVAESEVAEPSPGYEDYQVTSTRNPTTDQGDTENDIVYPLAIQAHNALIRGSSSGESSQSSSAGTSSSRGRHRSYHLSSAPTTPPSAKSLRHNRSPSTPIYEVAQSRSLPSSSSAQQRQFSFATTDYYNALRNPHRTPSASNDAYSNIEAELVEALPTFSRGETLRRWEVDQRQHSPQPSTEVHRQYTPPTVTDALEVQSLGDTSFRMNSQSSSKSSMGANPSALLLVQALQAEVKEGRKKESVDGYLVKMFELGMESDRDAFKLVHAGAVPTLIHLLKIRAAESYGVELVLITLGTLAHDSISANAIYRTGTAVTLVELVNSASTEEVEILAIWCLSRICRSAEVANGLVKLNLATTLLQTRGKMDPTLRPMPLFCLGTLIQSDALADFMASLGLVSVISDHLRRVSEVEVPTSESVCAGIYAVARISRSIKLAKALAKAGCVEIIAHHLKTSTDPEVLHWSARAVGCLMRPNSSDMSKTLLDADIARGLARLPTVLPPECVHPLGSFGFAIQRFSCAEWGGSTRKALVDAGVVDSLLSALRTAAHDHLCFEVHVDLALAVSLLGDVGGSAIRKEIVNAGGINILKIVSSMGNAEVSKACNMAITSITGNLFTRNAATAKTAMAHNWNGGCPDYHPPCPLTVALAD